MPRATVAALLVGLVFAVPSSAVPGSGQIAFATGGGLVTVNPDGTGFNPLRSTGYSPTWSPDGTKILAAEYQGAIVTLFVLNADGSDYHAVVIAPNIIRGPQAWAPDGSRVVFAHDGAVYSASSWGGDQRLVATAGVPSPPSWSPDGSLIAYASLGKLYVVAPDGTGRTEIADAVSPNAVPIWSPGADAVAVQRDVAGDGDAKLYTLRPDGTELHKLADLRAVNYPDWSPDGRSVLFSGTVENGALNAFAVDADGSHLRKVVDYALSPTWSPDGDQILFSRGSNLMRMNRNGSCVDLVTSSQGDLSGWSWQPVPGGPPIGTRRCNALALDYELTDVGTKGAFRLTVFVRNKGTAALSRVRLTARANSAVTPRGLSACTTLSQRVTCETSILPGEGSGFTILVRSRRFGRGPRDLTTARISLRATAPVHLLPTGYEALDATRALKTCSSRDPGGGRIDGSVLSDHICGRSGRDLIHPGLGLDFVRAGAGNDVIYASHDYEARDRIFCGPGRDVVVADRSDRVEKDCEQVRRG